MSLSIGSNLNSFAGAGSARLTDPTARSSGTGQSSIGGGQGTPSAQIDITAVTINISQTTATPGYRPAESKHQSGIDSRWRIGAAVRDVAIEHSVANPERDDKLVPPEARSTFAKQRHGCSREGQLHTGQFRQSVHQCLVCVRRHLSLILTSTDCRTSWMQAR